ncbi:MAG: hypothetical protein HOF01_10915 [Chloroflexi bacterium]|jgi:hypothetical protein|nr:hypothetical protein [Chloroflexota bacterium]
MKSTLMTLITWVLIASLWIFTASPFSASAEIDDDNQRCLAVISEIASKMLTQTHTHSVSGGVLFDGAVSGTARPNAVIVDVRSVLGKYCNPSRNVSANLFSECEWQEISNGKIDPSCG